MRKMINNLRQKPAHVRDRIAILSALSFAGLVAFFWMATLANEYASPETKTSFTESFSPFKLFGNNIKNALDRSKAQLSAIDPNGDGTAIDTGSVTVDANGVIDLGGTQENQ